MFSRGMYEGYKMLKIAIGVAYFIIVFGVPLVCLYIFRNDLSKIPRLTTGELRQMASKHPLLYSNAIVRELLSRGEDIHFALPLYLKMACGKKLLIRQVGWSGLKTYFSGALSEIDFTETRPSQMTLNQLRLLESKVYDSLRRQNQPGADI